MPQAEPSIFERYCLLAQFGSLAQYLLHFCWRYNFPSPAVDTELLLVERVPSKFLPLDNQWRLDKNAIRLINRLQGSPSREHSLNRIKVVQNRRARLVPIKNLSLFQKLRPRMSAQQLRCWLELELRRLALC